MAKRKDTFSGRQGSRMAGKRLLLRSVVGLALLAPVAAPAATNGAAKPQPAVRMSRSKQYGCERLDFRVPETRNRAFVVLPNKRPEKGPTPWVWFAPALRDARGRVRYPNRWHDWLFSRLLGGGVAVCGVDVGESWGNPKGREEFSKFYEFVVKQFGLSPKPRMFGQSRGGLMVLNWAADNPKKVQCIGAIYPVCKISVTPFFARVYNLGGRKTPKATWNRLPETEREKLNEAELRKEFKRHNPLDRLAPLAEAGVPLLTLHGIEDKLVPLLAHSVELVRRYRRLGGDARLIVRQGQRHRPADVFFESEELLTFLLRGGATGAKDEKTGATGK